MSSTADVPSPRGRRFVRRFVGAFAVILFALLGHQLAQEPETTLHGSAGTSPSTVTAGPAAAAANVAVEAVEALPLSVMGPGEGTLRDLAAHEENGHEPWSELGSICLLIAVVLLLATVAAPRRALLPWWLPRPGRAAAPGRLLVGFPGPTRVALSISRT